MVLCHQRHAREDVRLQGYLMKTGPVGRSKILTHSRSTCAFTPLVPDRSQLQHSLIRCILPLGFHWWRWGQLAEIRCLGNPDLSSTLYFHCTLCSVPFEWSPQSSTSAVLHIAVGTCSTSSTHLVVWKCWIGSITDVEIIERKKK